MATNREVISSRLGRRIIIVLVLAVTAPLILFATPMYYQTRKVSIEETDRSLQDYARFCARHIVQTLSVAKVQLAYISRGGSIPAGESYFMRCDMISPSVESLPKWLPGDVVRKISGTGPPGTGMVYLSSPFLVDASSGGRENTVGMALSVGDGRIVAGVIDPIHLWRSLATTVRSRENGFFVLNQHGVPFTGGDGAHFENDQSQLEQSRMEYTAPIVPLRKDATRQTGISTLPGIGEARWAHDRIFLGGMFLSDEWGILTFRRQASVMDLPRQLFSILSVLLLVSILAAFAIALRTASHLYIPIADLLVATRALAGGEWTPRAQVSRDDELGELARSFNQMTEEVWRATDARARAEGEAMIGRLAATVAHEVNNPLAAIKNRIGLLRRRLRKAEVEELDGVDAQIDRIGRIVRSLLDFSAHQVCHEPVSVGRIVKEAADLFAPSFRARGIGLEVDIPDNLPCPAGDAGAIQQILVNLLENAREALVGGQVRIAARDVDGSIEIMVEDDGPGLGPDPERLLRPHTSSKPGGTGLGLSIVRKICEEHGGTLIAENRPEGGARFTARLSIIGGAMVLPGRGITGGTMP